ncbi:MAG: hypothetical protein VX768_06745 [Planctomycetota bacterium]|nr:hypothetical protein [Planctomycetota bacterium]
MREFFFESSFKIVGYGMFLTVPFYVMAHHFRNRRLWIVSHILVGLIALGVLVERWVVTPREEIRNVVSRLADIVEQNDVEGLLQHVSKSRPEVVDRARSEMPSYDFNSCNLMTFHKITVDENNPARASADFMVSVNLTMKGYQGSAWRDVVLNFEKESDGKWRIVEYSHHDPTNRKERTNFFF